MRRWPFAAIGFAGTHSEDMPESSGASWLLPIADSFLFAAARYLDTGSGRGEIKAALLAGGTEKAAWADACC